MRLIQSIPSKSTPHGETVITLHASRAQLSKRRWRGVAENGAEFGFDLVHPLEDGALFLVDGNAAYQVRQSEEPVLEIVLPCEPEEAARLGWMLGNLHFPVEVEEGVFRLPDDTAVRQMLARERIEFHATQAVFHLPPVTGHLHDHGHSHHHHSEWHDHA